MDSWRAPHPTRHHRWLVLPTQELSKPDENYSPSPSNCARHHDPGVQRPRHSIAFEGILITPSISIISPHRISLRLVDRPPSLSTISLFAPLPTSSHPRFGAPQSQWPPQPHWIPLRRPCFPI